jgi:hypothetical protein
MSLVRVTGLKGVNSVLATGKWGIWTQFRPAGTVQRCFQYDILLATNLS